MIDPVSIIAKAASEITSAVATMVSGRQELKIQQMGSDRLLNDQILSQRAAQERQQHVTLVVMAFIAIGLLAAIVIRR